MAYRAATLYPFTEAGEGANNRKIRDTSGGAGNTATQCAFGTTTTVRFIQARPLVSNSTSATPAAAQNFGWNVLKADMNETANPPNKRYIAAGNWVFSGALTASTADAASSSYRVRVFAHRRSPTGVLTQIGASADSAAAAITTSINWTATMALPEIILETDETLHFEYWVQGRGGGATGLLSQTITFNVGTTLLQSELTIATPAGGITTRYYRSGFTATMLGVAGAVIRRVRLRLSAIMVGVAAAVRRKVGIRRSATMVGVAAVRKKVGIRLSAVMVGVAAVRKRVGKKLSAVMVGIAAVRKKIGKRGFNATMVGVAAFTRRLTLFRAFANVMVGVAAPIVRKLRLRRAFAATMVGVVRAFIKLKFENLPAGGGGGGGNTYSKSRVTNT